MKPFSFKDATRICSNDHHGVGPASFNCSLEHNRNTSCSIIKMFDIVNNSEAEKHNNFPDLQERVSTFVREHLFDAFNFLPASDLKRLIFGNSNYLQNCYKVPDDEHETSIILFQSVDVPLVHNPSSVITVQTISLLFKFAKKNLNVLRSHLGSMSDAGLLSSNSMPSSDNHFYELRQSINDFFGFLKRTLYLIANNTSENVHQSLNLFQLCSSILKELKSLLIFTGRISQFRNFLWLKHKKAASNESPFQHLSDQKTALYSYYHVVLEIWWSAIEVSYLMQISSLSRYNFNDIFLVKEDSSTSNHKINGHPMFTQAVRIFFYDILLLGSRNHFETSFTTSNDYRYQSPFICTCSWEIIVAIRMLITASNSTIVSEKIPPVSLDLFYHFIFDVLNLFDGSTAKKANGQMGEQLCNEDKMQIHEVYFENFSSISLPKLAISSETNFCLFQMWIFSNIAPLLPIDLDVSNQLQVGTFKVTYPTVLTKTVRKALKICESANSTQSRVHSELAIFNLLILVLKNSQFLTFSNLDLLLLFVEYFLKKLNVNYNVQSRTASSVHEYVSWMPRNSLSWYKDVERLLKKSNEESNNFKLFLCLLASQLQELFYGQIDEQKNVNGNFQKLVSKIVVTLQPRTLKQFDSMAVFNLCSFYLTLVVSIPVDRLSDFLDKLLNIFGEIGKNICAESKPNSSMAELLIQFHFALIQQEKFSKEITRKVIAQQMKLFENLQTSLFNSNSNQYTSFVRLYFEELELLIDLLKSSSSSKRYFQLLETIFLKVDLVKILRNLRSSKSTSEFQKSPQVIEILGELLQFFIESIQIYESRTLATDSLSLENGHEMKDLLEFAKKFNENVKDLVKSELTFLAEDTDLEVISNIAFNVTLLTLLIENQNHLNEKPLCTTICFFLHITDKPHTSFQINYLYLLCEDFQIISKLKKEVSLDLFSEMNILLLSFWCRFLPTGISTFPEKMSSISRNLVRNILSINATVLLTETEKSLDEEILDYYRMFLQELQLKYSTLGSHAERLSYSALVKKYFCPLITECRVIFASVNSKTNAYTINVKQLKTVLWLITYLLNTCCIQLYIAGKSDCLLALIFEHLLIVPSATLIDSNDSTLSKCFLLIFEGLCQLNSDAYLERKTRLLIAFYLPYIVKANTFAQIKSIYSQKKIYEQWKSQLLSTMEKMYLVQRNTTISKPVYDFFVEFLKSEVALNSNQLIQLASGLNNGLALNDFNQTDNRVLLWQLIVCTAFEQFSLQSDLTKQCLENVIVPFLRTNLKNHPVKCFKVLKSLLPVDAQKTCPLMFHELCGELHRLMDEIERQSLAGNNSVLRKLLKDFITSYIQNGVD